MSREFKQTTQWIDQHFDDTEIVLQSGYNLYLNARAKKEADNAKNK